jgi:colanic acid biosynthesis protein WcaH
LNRAGRNATLSVVTNQAAHLLRENTGTSGVVQTAQAAVAALAIHDIPHLIVGGIAVQEYGYPRVTIDVDIVMKPEPKPGQWLAPEDFDTIVRLTPLVSIDLIVRSPDGRILVGRRHNEPAKGYFFVPGGRISKNETLAAAIKRISWAELGAERLIAETRFLGVYEHLYATNNHQVPGFGTHYVVLAYELSSDSQDLQFPPDQHGEFAWLSEAEILRNPEVHENVKAYFTSGKPAR